jgi:hypothetical protein
LKRIAQADSARHRLILGIFWTDTNGRNDVNDIEGPWRIFHLTVSNLKFRHLIFPFICLSARGFRVRIGSMSGVSATSSFIGLFVASVGILTEQG